MLPVQLVKAPSIHLRIPTEHFANTSGPIRWDDLFRDPVDPHAATVGVISRSISLSSYLSLKIDTTRYAF
jgi:hypothetical protein